MKKSFILLFIVMLILGACEKDDFCTTATPLTPKLVLRFYDNANPTELKATERLSAIASSKTDSLFVSQSTDSIALPLNTLATETVYTLKTNTVDGSTANNLSNVLTIKYTTEDVFVSRACGYKTIFNNVEITSDNGWFISLTPANLETINNETTAHVKVYH